MPTAELFPKLRVLILHQNGLYAAQCIDHDIVAQGTTISAVKKALERTIIGQVVADLRQGKKPLGSFPPAPAKLQRLFERAEKLDDQEPITLPPTYMCQQISKEIRIL
jgi:hypothetical protein